LRWVNVTPVIDHDYFLSIYFRQRPGVLFEIATTSPGFAVDEDPARLGEELRLPTQHEHQRPRLERILTPLTNPRSAQRAEVRSWAHWCTASGRRPATPPACWSSTTAAAPTSKSCSGSPT
jgi:hypothetical protein